MKLNWKFGATLVAASSLMLFGSCGEDEVPKSTIGFEETEMEIWEANAAIGLSSVHPLLIEDGDGTGRVISLTIDFDKAMAETTVIRYSLEGTADLNSTANPIGDYEIIGNNEFLVLEKGERSIDLDIRIYEDFEFEDDETIIVTLEEVVNGSAKIGDENVFTVNLIEDDAVVFLFWDNGDNNDVDMDAYLFLEDEVVGGSAGVGTSDEDFEAYNIPAGYPNGTYGTTYTYYSGTSNNVEFEVDMFNFGGTLNGGTYDSFDEQPLVFIGNYTLDNLNTYTDEEFDPIVVQTIVKNGHNYSNITQISEPSSGSRLAPSNGKLINDTMKLPKLPREMAQKLAQRLRD